VSCPIRCQHIARTLRSFTDDLGFWFHPEQQTQKRIARFHAPQIGTTLRGQCSFIENFSGENGHLLRKAPYGNQWILNPRWHLA